MKFESKFGLGDICFLKTDVEQFERMIIACRFSTNGVIYTLVCGEKDSDHFEIEMSAKKDLLKELNITQDARM